MATSDTWRLAMTALSSGKDIALYEVILYDGVTNLIGGGTPTSDTKVVDRGPELAFDGDPATFWQSTAVVSAHWVQYVFASPVTPTSYSVKAASSIPPRLLTLQYWDGAAFVAAESTHTTTGGSWAGNATQTFVLPAATTATARYPYHDGGVYA